MLVAALVLGTFVFIDTARPEPTYQRQGSRVETVLASLKASGLPTLQGPWHWIGPFANEENAGFDRADPPEREINLTKSYPGRDGMVSWKEYKGFALGKVVDLKPILGRANPNNALLYLVHEFESPEAMEMPISFGSDDSLKVWLNGKLVIEDPALRAASPDQNVAKFKLVKGKNTLLVKVTNVGGDYAVYVAPELPSVFPETIRKKLDKDFPVVAAPSNPTVKSAEAKYYKITTMPQPADCVLEVGGIGVRPDGTLLVCTRRGEIWHIKDPGGETSKMEFRLWASGLHEALGLFIDGSDVFVVQRPELTRIRANNADDKADEFVTICDKWGVSGDYHEFAFGPARDKEGNFYITLNVGFGGGHQAKAPWRGWCVKVSPKGEMTPIATGLRSPNGINFSPEGDLFYCDNQGEWVATNKMHHIRPGDNYGHQAGLKWVSKSPFAQTLKESYPSGMLYDGQKGTQRDGMPPHTPPTIWFPYGKMGQSASEPIWDTTGGKFGPFAGQCFVGDQTKSIIMRVYLEKIRGEYQGACFPFRGGFQCGINRLCFDKDANLYVGETNRGWGSLGGKPYGLERLNWTGEVPFEIHSMKLQKGGFELVFTKPLDVESASRLMAYNLASHTYNYWPTYGSPEVDAKAEKVKSVEVRSGGQSVFLAVDNLRVGRVYDLTIDSALKSRDGDSILHPEAYYTLNWLP
jgi:hypothetical protein